MTFLLQFHVLWKYMNRNGTNVTLTAIDSISRVSHVARAVEAANSVYTFCIHSTVVNSKYTLINICKKIKRIII